MDSDQPSSPLRSRPASPPWIVAALGIAIAFASMWSPGALVPQTLGLVGVVGVVDEPAAEPAGDASTQRARATTRDAPAADVTSAGPSPADHLAVAGSRPPTRSPHISTWRSLPLRGPPLHLVLV